MKIFTILSHNAIMASIIVTAMIPTLFLQDLSACGGQLVSQPPNVWDYPYDLVISVQRELKNKGSDPGPVDGIYGRYTDAAVQRYRKSNNLTDAGGIDRLLLARLFNNSQTSYLKVVYIAQVVLTFYRYFDGPINGFWNADLSKSINHFQTTITALYTDAYIESYGEIDSPTIKVLYDLYRKIISKIVAEILYPNYIDKVDRGYFDERITDSDVTNALKKFQKSNSLKQTGRLNRKTINLIKPHLQFQEEVPVTLTFREC